MDNGQIRKFVTGATRDTSKDKLEPFGFISPLVLHRFSQYMHKHRKQADGTMRSSDNWQRGIPIPVYLHSLMRHVMDFWLVVSGFQPRFDPEVNDATEIACAILFNVQGFLHETLKTDLLKTEGYGGPTQEVPTPQEILPEQGCVYVGGIRVDGDLSREVDAAFARMEGVLTNEREMGLLKRS